MLAVSLEDRKLELLYVDKYLVRKDGRLRTANFGVTLRQLPLMVSAVMGSDARDLMDGRALRILVEAGFLEEDEDEP